MKRRRLVESFFKLLMLASICIVIASFLLIIGVVLAKSLPALKLSILTQTPKGGYYLGKEGGILNAIVGSLELAFGATLLAILISLPIVFYLNLYAKRNSPIASFTRFSFDVLWGIPSIVYGAFGFLVMIFIGIRTSLLAGILTVAFLELPIMSRGMDEVLRLVPVELREASFSLGATRLETGLKVVLRQCFPGILTAVLIAFGRGIGDAASVLFTAGFSDRIPMSLFQPAATLPLAIFYQLGTPYPEVQARAYASAAMLTMIILLVSLVSRALASKYTKHRIK